MTGRFWTQSVGRLRSQLSVGHLKRNLGAVRELGVGKDLEEFSDGCCCVAVPIVGPQGLPVASIGLSCPAERWRQDHAVLTSLVKEAGEHASAAVGGPIGLTQSI
jgi:DNA-binding IclR family transcriptional regulator